MQILYAMSEKELIILLKNGDEKAFTTLYRLYWSKVYNFSRLYLSSITEVEEVVQGSVCEKCGRHVIFYVRMIIL